MPRCRNASTKAIDVDDAGTPAAAATADTWFRAPCGPNTKLPEVHAHITASGFSPASNAAPVGEPFVAAEVEQGVDAVGVLADGRDRHRQAHRAGDARLERGKVVLGAVAGVEQAHRWHVISLGSR